MRALVGLQKDTDDLTGKATEGSTKITSEAAKMAEGMCSVMFSTPKNLVLRRFQQSFFHVYQS